MFQKLVPLILLLTAMFFVGCQQNQVQAETDPSNRTGASVDDPDSQKAGSDSPDFDPYGGDPDYERVYDTSQVKRIDITIPSENWQAMTDEFESQLAEELRSRNFVNNWFECQVDFEGDTWQHVGIRFKGNSSIFRGIRSGTGKVPFKLDFDEFEDIYPETDDQRFWGLKFLVFNNNFKDPTMLRELLTYDLMRESGAIASRAAHYRLFIDIGDGPEYFGLYTSVEVVDERFLEDRFGDDSGNLYKPDGPGSDLTSFMGVAMEKETNEDEADWSDVERLINILNAPYPGPSYFISAIEQVFDVDTFLSWLAVNSVLCNIDSYAGTGHNYFLYNNPVDGKFYFIPWDCNESFGTFYGSRNAGNMHQWDIFNPTDAGPKPLIEKILEVPEYMAEYTAKIRVLLAGPLSESEITQRIETLHNLARPYVIGSQGEFPPNTLLSNQNLFDENLYSNITESGPGNPMEPGMAPPGMEGQFGPGNPPPRGEGQGFPQDRIGQGPPGNQNGNPPMPPGQDGFMPPNGGPNMEILGLLPFIENRREYIESVLP